MGAAHPTEARSGLTRSRQRAICPTCHAKRVQLWAEDLLEHTLSEVPHRFWTFAIPKRLRPYFLHDRKRLSDLVTAAHQTFEQVLSSGKPSRALRPAVITLVQTFGDDLHWHCHLHCLAADGVFDTRDPDALTFRPCSFWNLPAMTEIFRFLLIDRLHRKKVLTDDVATNLMAWPHSGFHVHASEPFPISNREELTRRLAYAFRTPVSLSQLTYTKEAVHVRTRKGRALTFSPLDFLAHLTVHIPNHYQHMRRYAGLYASATRRFLGLQTKASVARTSEKPRTPRWASLLARIFGQLPLECPNCHTEMRLLGFVTHPKEIAFLVPDIARAPPQRRFESFFDVHGKIPFLVAAQETVSYGTEHFSQARVEQDEDFDQTQSW
jgi:hypothetical protein